jgi:hypothetical protein
MSRLGAVHFYSLYADFVVKRRNSFSKNFSCFSALYLAKIKSTFEMNDIRGGRVTSYMDAEFRGGQVPARYRGGSAKS